MIDNNQFFILYSNCIPVKGYKRSIICDLQKGCYYFITNDTYEILKELRNRRIRKVYEVYNVDNYYTLINHELPIAIITNNLTASAGEILTIAFKGKENVRIFGEKTNGLTTGTTPFVLQDSIFVFLTTSNDLDKMGNKYLRGVVPQNLKIRHELTYRRMAMTWILNNKDSL